MSTIKAIETSYKGCRFRSRLEARWAVFFDALGIAWQYESQGYKKEIEDDDAICYLPDFFLPDWQTWVEVKGTDEALREEKRLGMFLDYGSPLPHFDDSAGTDGVKYWPPYLSADVLAAMTEERRSLFRVDRRPRLHGLLFLGDVPDPTRFGMHLHPLVQHSKGLRWSLVYFGPPSYGSGYGPRRLDLGDLAPCFFDPSVPVEESEDGYDWPTSNCRVRSEFIPTAFYWQKVLDAYRAARSARFEHGESGSRS